MDHKTCIFMGGKQIGVNCLRILVEKKVIPQLVVCNLEDTGEDTWHESILKEGRKNTLPLIYGKKVKDPEVIKTIQKIHPDIIFCIGATQLIPSEILKIPSSGTLNIHPALLPKYRGRYSTAHAIFNGEEHTGVTLHWMDEGIDSGPIILQEKIKIEEDDTARTLYDKFTETGSHLFENFLSLWLSGKPIPSTPQNEEEATYYPKGMPNNGEIDWSWEGRKIRNFLRAMTFEPFPPPSFQIGKKKMLILDEKYFKGF